jgi:hypothetical protein
MAHQHLALSALALLGLASTGCLVISANRSVSPAPSPAPREVYRPADEFHSSDLLVKEVDAAAALGFEQSRVEALTRIARRVPLRPDIQARLVWAAYLRMDFEQNKMELIRTVLKNPSCEDDARGAVLDGLNHLSFEQNRRELLELVGGRAG